MISEIFCKITQKITMPLMRIKKMLFGCVHFHIKRDTSLTFY